MVRDNRFIEHGGEAVYLPKQPKVKRWADAERDPDHVAIKAAAGFDCSCGWSGPSWITHWIEATDEPKETLTP